MSDEIFLMRGEQLVGMAEEPYETEDLLQGLIEQYPNLLGGEQINAEAPRRWLLIQREVSVASEDKGSARWSLDHLFLDQDAIPTLVEVKRSSNTQIRREVVGQMLDYAANGVRYWKINQIRRAFEQDCESKDKDPDVELATLLEHDADVEDFWNKVESNLRQGKVRLVFAADEIPSELQRIVEFLNEQMNLTEVVAVSIRQYVGEGHQILVPRVIGQTTAAQQMKGEKPARHWDETSWLAELTKLGQEQAEVGRKILEWANDAELLSNYTAGGSFKPLLKIDGKTHRFLYLRSDGNVEIPLKDLHGWRPFNDEDKLDEILKKLNTISGVDIPNEKRKLYPSFSIDVLTDTNALETFLKTLDWILIELKSTSG